MHKNTTMTEDSHKILIVEDDMLIIEMVSLKLSDNGYYPEFVINGTEAIEKMRMTEPKLVILDLMLPGMSGEEILAEMKQQVDLKDIPVIVFTNKSKEENEKKMLELGASEYLVKASTDLSTLLHRIDSYLKTE